MSKSCQICALKKAKCYNMSVTNFVGCSPAVESERVVLWGRSIKRHNLRYKSHKTLPSSIASVLEESHPSAEWQQDAAPVTLPEVFLEVFGPTFMTLTNDKLQERCVLGTTQNPCKCVMKSIVWIRCPKHKHHGVKVVCCAVASAVCHFGSGESRLRVMERLSIPGGVFTRESVHAKDEKRPRKSD